MSASANASVAVDDPTSDSSTLSCVCAAMLSLLLHQKATSLGRTPRFRRGLCSHFGYILHNLPQQFSSHSRTFRIAITIHFLGDP